MRAEKKLYKLKSEVERHNDLYYKHANPLISDKEFDELLARVSELENELGYNKNNSPTTHVGSDSLKHFKKVKHDIPMLSIQNSYNINDLIEFMNRCLKVSADITFTLEPKIDGLAISIKYENGNLIQACTRGDGETGDDVTNNVKCIRDIPHHIKYKKPIEIRGEIFINKDDFDKLNDQRKQMGLAALANPRNAAAGSLKIHDIGVVKARPLRSVFYSVPEIKSTSIRTHIQEVSFIKEIGLNSINLVDCGDKDIISDLLSTMKDEKFIFPTDGAVIRVNEIDKYSEIGYTSKFPKWICAYKFETNTVDTELISVDWQIGRTGVYTPVMRIKPVELNGTTISNVTLHNLNYIDYLDIRIGDIIVIEKAGEIIPHIVKSKKEFRKYNKTTPIEIPKKCIYCDKELTIDGPRLVCTNRYCRGKKIKYLIYFASKDCMDINTVGPAIIEQLFEVGLIEDVYDFYYLKRDDLENIAGFKSKTSTNIINGIKQSINQPAYILLTALGIPGIGKVNAKSILKVIHSIEDLLDKPKEFFISNIPNIGDITAKYLSKFLSYKRTKITINEFKKIGFNLSYESTSKEDAKHYVITGVFKLPRRVVIQLIKEQLNGIVDASVTAKTAALLIGDDKYLGTTKYTKAIKMNIPIIPIGDVIKI